MDIEINFKNCLITAMSMVCLITGVYEITRLIKLSSLNKDYDNNVNREAQRLVDSNLCINDLII